MKVLITLCIFLSVMTLSAQSSITGIWDTGKENTKIQITEVEGVMNATIYSSDNSKLEIGAPFLKEVMKDGDEWKGKLYSFKKRKWFQVTITEREEELQAKVKAGAMKKKLKWTRV